MPTPTWPGTTRPTAWIRPIPAGSWAPTSPCTTPPGTRPSPPTSARAPRLPSARHYLKSHVPTLPWYRRLALAVETPLILGTMAQLMLRPSSDVVKTYEIPKDTIREAYVDNPDHKAGVRASLKKVR